MNNLEGSSSNTGENTGNLPRDLAERRGEETISAAEYATKHENDAILADAKKTFDDAQQYLNEIKAEENNEPAQPDLEVKAIEVTDIPLHKEDDALVSPEKAPSDIKTMEAQFTNYDDLFDNGDDGDDGGNGGNNGPHETEPVAEADDTPEKGKKNRSLKKLLTAYTAIGIASLVVGMFGGYKYAASKDANKTPTTPNIPDRYTTEQSVDRFTETAAEKERMSISYNYDDYARFDEKSSHNAYGTSRVDCYGDPEKTSAEFMKTAEDMPEALASYRGIFFEDEQKALGIDGMTDSQLDDHLSDINSEDAATMQQKLLAAMRGIVADKENTKWEFNLENSRENSHYVVWEDVNEDGIMTPNEMHLGYSVASRHDAPQANLYRKDKDGNWTKMLDLNLYCRFQPNTPVNKTPSVPFIPEEEEVTPTPQKEKVTPPKEEEETPQKEEVTPTPEEETVTPPPVIPPMPTPIVTPEPKNAENLIRIDEQIEKDIEEDIHTEDLVVPQTEHVAEVEEITEKPTAEEYQGTEPTIIQREEEPAPTIEVTEANEYSHDLGGANVVNAPENPVTPNPEAQAEADRNEIPVSETPSGGQEVVDILAGLGID